MIIDSFDLSKPFIRAEDLYHEVPRNDLLTFVTFKIDVLNYAIEKYHATLKTSYPTTNGKQEVYSFIYEGKEYLIYQSGICAAYASTIMKEVSVVTGSHQFIFFGSCGVLNEEMCRGKIIIPTNSYRDEGISYHYQPASDTIDIRNSSKLINAFEKLHLPYVAGKVWTTDAIYMETVNKVNKHKSEGVIAVEMEVSGVEAVARHYNIDNYHMLFSADSLADMESWEVVDFASSKEIQLQIEAFEVALLVAKNL